MLRHHLFNNGFDEVDVTVTPGVPRPVDTIWEDADKLGSVAHGFHTHVIILELIVLHPSGILIIAVTEDEQRTVLTQVFRHNDIIRAAGAVNCDVVCRHRQQSSYQQEER